MFPPKQAMQVRNQIRGVGREFSTVFRKKNCYRRKCLNNNSSVSRHPFRAAREYTFGNCIIVITPNCLIPIFYILRNSILLSSCNLLLVKLLNLQAQHEEAIILPKFMTPQCLMLLRAILNYITTTTITTGLVGYYSSTVRSIQ